jgi:tRNA pseudouridine55 synthase
MSSKRGNPVHGIVLVNKTVGLSSNALLQKVKRLFNAQKAGHTGALDPLASGMLPICLGEATKFSQFLLDANKKYIVKAQLGQRTTTSDADGEVVSTRDVHVTLAQLEQAIESFRGKTEQMPSMYSALKYEGQPLYKYARQGIEVPRKTRMIEVFDIQLLSFENDCVELMVHCSKGTYIRTIIDDMGELLGCGAFVSKLHRTEVAHYPVKGMRTLEDLEALNLLDSEGNSHLMATMLPVDTAVSNLAPVILNSHQVQDLYHGKTIRVPSQPASTMVRLISEEHGIFLGVALRMDTGDIEVKRLIQERYLAHKIA